MMEIMQWFWIVENLRNYLQNNHSKLTLKDRIAIFRCLCLSLYRIHEKDLIHCDLHSGNMLIQAGGCFITVESILLLFFLKKNKVMKNKRDNLNSPNSPISSTISTSYY